MNGRDNRDNTSFLCFSWIAERDERRIREEGQLSKDL